MKQVILPPFAFLAALVVLACGPLRADPDPKGPMPPQDFVMARFWKNFHLVPATMEGILRTPTKTYPFKMKTSERVIFMDIPTANLSLEIEFSSSQTTVKRGKAGGKDMRTLGAAQHKERILDTDITYEDLGLTFLNWPDMKEAGTDSIKTLPAYAYDVKSPGGKSAYSGVRFWISSEFFALLRVDAKNKDGKVVKRVEVNGVQKVGNAYVIKEMQVSSFAPGRESSKSRTYLEIREVKLQ